MLIPLFRRIDAVFWDVDFHKIVRVPLVAIEEYAEGDVSMSLILITHQGRIMPLHAIRDEFLGMEFDGIQQDWMSKGNVQLLPKSHIAPGNAKEN